LAEVPQASVASLSLSAASTTTASPALARVRGFTVDLLWALKEGGLRTRDVCEKTRKPSNYVSRYLWNMQNYGLVMKNASFWNLTVLGQDFVCYLERERSTVVEARNLNERKKKEERNLNVSLLKRVEFQSRFDLWLKENPLSDVEKVVVDYLIVHYHRTGSKFILVDTKYELAERLNQNPEDLVQALRKLFQDRVAYLFKHGLGWKVGLYQAFVECLEKTEGVSS
jgi:hypothetical protein